MGENIAPSKTTLSRPLDMFYVVTIPFSLRKVTDYDTWDQAKGQF